MNPEIYSKKELLDYYNKVLVEQQKCVVQFCPISSSKCIVVYRKDYSDFSKDLAKKIGPDLVLSVNKLIISSSLGRLYSNNDKKEEILAILSSLP